MFSAAALLVSLSGCASVPHAVHGGRVLDIWTKMSTTEFIRVRGIGAAPTEVQGQTARRGASRNSALVAARYELLALIQGVKLEGGVTVSQLMEKDSLIREIANEVVSGGEEALVEWLPDGGCVVTLELRRSKVEHLIQQRSDRERGLEKRIAKDISEIGDLKEELEIYKHAHDEADARRMMREYRAYRIFGSRKAPWTWLAGAGSSECWFALTKCYWVDRPSNP